MVETCKEYIRAGDAFQIVPSQRFSVPFKLPPLSLYRSLRRINPSPFLIFFDYGDFTIVGSSPEILVRLRDGKITMIDPYTSQLDESTELRAKQARHQLREERATGQRTANGFHVVAPQYLRELKDERIERGLVSEGRVEVEPQCAM